jgi:hypothetical protein
MREFFKPGHEDLFLRGGKVVFERGLWPVNVCAARKSFHHGKNLLRTAPLFHFFPAGA